MAHCEPKLKYPGKVFMHTSSLRTKDFFGVGLPHHVQSAEKYRVSMLANFKFSISNFRRILKVFSKFLMSKILSCHTSYSLKISAQKLNSIKSYSKMLNFSIFPQFLRSFKIINTKDQIKD
jgi:hypothetical protein